MRYFETNSMVIMTYLIEEQGMDEDVVARMGKEELEELWEHYHEY